MPDALALQIVCNENGDRATPAAVFVPETRAEKLVVGAGAFANVVRNPERVLHGAVHLLGVTEANAERLLGPMRASVGSVSQTQKGGPLAWSVRVRVRRVDDAATRTCFCA